MRNRLLAVGSHLTSWVNEGVEDYLKRFPPSCSLELIEIPAEKRMRTSVPAKLMEREGERLIKAIKPGNLVVALAVKGKSWSTEQLASYLEGWKNEGRHVDMLIGGPDGLSEECLKKANIHWSLSPLTLPHPLVRIIVAEQLYRAVSILQNHPYHR